MEKQQLLNEIEAGVSHHSLTEVAKICSESLANNEQEIDSLFIFILWHLCSDVANYLDASAPVSTPTHAKIEEMIRDPLVGAIGLLGSSDLVAKVTAYNHLVGVKRQLGMVG